MDFWYGHSFVRKLVILTVKQYRRLVNNILMQILAYHNYRDSDITTIAIAIVIYYRDILHYRYYRTALIQGDVCVM